MNTWAFAPWPGGPFPYLLELIRSQRGEAFVLKMNGYLEPALSATTHHAEHLTRTVMVAYRAPFPAPESPPAMLFQCLPEVKKQLWGGMFWSRSYYVESVGAMSLDVGLTYIEPGQE